MSAVESVRWSADGAAVDIIDQRLLPGALVRRELRTADDVCDAILSLAVRGAPAIGVAGAMGLVVALAPHAADHRDGFLARAAALGERISRVRPTAVNLSWAVARMLHVARATAGDARCVLDALRLEATAILVVDREMCRRSGEHGLALLHDGARVLTHCNAGALATAGHGTALGVLRSAVEAGKHIEVYADETRPFLQGARLTAWELQQDGIPVTLIADSAAPFLMSRGKVDAVIVGADRVAANGDVANKIGTYGLAVLARRHGIPFYVACPLSTIDVTVASGADIPIEERDAEEVLGYRGARWAPEGTSVVNPVFDVTPAELVTALITEKGVTREPDAAKIAALMRGA